MFEKPEEYWHSWNILSKKNWVRITVAMYPRLLSGGNISFEVGIRSVRQLTFHKNSM